MKKRNYIYIFSAVFIFSLIFSFVFINLDKKSDAAPYELPIDPVESYYKGNYTKGIYFYEGLVERNEAEPGDLKNLALLYKEKGELKKAISIYKDILDREKSADYYYLIAKYYYQLGDYKLAEDYFKEVYAPDEGVKAEFEAVRDELLCYYLGEVYLNQDKYDLAEALFLEGISYNSDLALNYLSLAELYSKKGEITDSIKYYKKALSRDGSLSQIYPLIAQGYDELEKEAESYDYWIKSIMTGEKKEMARGRIEELKNEFPYLKEEKETEKKLSRDNIDWIDIKNAPVEKDLRELRVGIVDNVAKISFQSNSSFEILHNGHKIIDGKAEIEWGLKRKSGKYEIYRKDHLITSLSTEDRLEIKNSSSDGIFIVYDISYGSGYFWAGSEDRQYRGDFELYTLNETRFNLVNIVNMAEYLYSVIPAEMPALWPKEALKAQTVAARSYALKHFDRHLKEGYNLCDSVHCAAYKGVGSEHIRSNQAVDKTLGETAYFDGRIVDAVFSSNSGGYCESSEDVWGNKIAYLSGVSTMLEKKYEFPLSPFRLNRWLKTSPPSYSESRYSSANIYRWVKPINIDYFLEKYDLSQFSDIRIMARSKGGSVKAVEIIGKKDIDNTIFKKVIKKDYIRGALNGLRSNRFMIDRIYASNGNIEEIILYGAGWGHNVGMDQTAAASMAEKGFTYKEIIKYFYKGSEISKYNLQ